MGNDLNGDDSDRNSNDNGLIGSLAYRIPPSSLYNSVAVGGTFDGMHYGHRKLLTLAISSVVSNPTSPGKLLIGVTSDEMLVSKEYSELIPSLKERIKELNKHRVKVLGMKPLKLLCTRRTEAHGTSSTV